MFPHFRASSLGHLLSSQKAFGFRGLGFTVNTIKLETGLRPNSAGIPCTLLLGIEAIGFSTFWLLR